MPETAPSSEISPVIRQTSPRSWALTPASADQQQQRVTTASVSSRRRVSSSIGALALRWPRWHRRSILAEQQHARRRLRSSFGGAAGLRQCGAARTGRHVRDAFKRAGVDPSMPAGTGELCFLLICKDNFSPIGDGTSSSVSRVGTVVSTRRFAEMLSMLAIHRSSSDFSQQRLGQQRLGQQTFGRDFSQQSSVSRAQSAEPQSAELSQHTRHPHLFLHTTQWYAPPARLPHTHTPQSRHVRVRGRDRARASFPLSLLLRPCGVRARA